MGGVRRDSSEAKAGDFPSRTGSHLSVESSSATELADAYVKRIIGILNEVGDTVNNPIYLYDGPAVTRKAIEISLLVYCAKCLSEDDEFVTKRFAGKSNGEAYRALFQFNLHYSRILAAITPQYNDDFCNGDEVVLRTLNILAQGMSDLSTARVGSALDPLKKTEQLRYQVNPDAIDAAMLGLIAAIKDKEFVRSHVIDGWGHADALAYLEGIERMENEGRAYDDSKRREIFQSHLAMLQREASEREIAQFVERDLQPTLDTLDCSPVTPQMPFTAYRRLHRFSRRRLGTIFALVGVASSTYLESVFARTAFDRKDGLSWKEGLADAGIRLGVAAVFFLAGFVVQWARAHCAYQKFMTPPAALARAFSDLSIMAGAGGAHIPGVGKSPVSPLLAEKV